MRFVHCVLIPYLAAAVFAVPVISYAADNAATQALHQLFDREWEYQMAHDPVTASQLGDRRWNDKWQDLSLKAVRETFQHAREVLAQLHTVDRAQLSGEDQVSYDVFDYNTSDYLQGEPYKWYLVRTNTFEGIQTVEGTVNSLRFETVKDYDDWLGRMRNFPAYMEQNIGLMREGIKDRILLPKVIGEKVLTQLNGMDWQDPTKHGFYKPFKQMPPSFSDADKQRLTAAAQQTSRARCCRPSSASASSCREITSRPRSTGRRLAGTRRRRHLRLPGSVENDYEPHARTDSRDRPAGSQTHRR